MVREGGSTNSPLLLKRKKKLNKDMATPAYGIITRCIRPLNEYAPTEFGRNYDLLCANVTTEWVERVRTESLNEEDNPDGFFGSFRRAFVSQQVCELVCSMFPNVGYREGYIYDPTYGIIDTCREDPRGERFLTELENILRVAIYGK